MRLPERRLHFNIDELCNLVAKSVNRPPTELALVKKLAEGGSYRVFEATFCDKSKVIVRLPYPCTIPREYGIASEVATIKFLRLHGIPVPKILDWSSSTSNPLGSEYIIMEQVSGKELSETWHSMSFEERMSIVKKIVHLESLLFSIPFPASGSLFLKGFLNPEINTVDIPNDHVNPRADKFCIGPSTEYLWWYQKRNELAANRGPCEHFSPSSLYAC